MANESKLSVIILAKNEAETIGDCIDGVKNIHPQEVLVIDDESSDDTAKIAKLHGASVINVRQKNFAQMREFAAAKATGDWLFYVDADERVTKALSVEIQTTLAQESPPTAYEIKRVNFYLGKRWPKEEVLLRLMRKSSLIKWFGAVHETPEVSGEIGTLNAPLYHYTHRNLEEMVENTLRWSTVEAQLRVDTNHPPVTWWRIPRVMITQFFTYYISQGGWKVGTVGLIESTYQAFSIFITYAKLWELQNKTRLQQKSL
jgi:glycosyltransferase involved in cell wall biosynthesis